MPPETKRQQNTQQHCNQQATSMRRLSQQRAQTRASVTTEYQERFLPPSCRVAVVSTSTQKSPYHPLKGTNAFVNGFRSYYVKSMWMKNPSKTPQLPQPPQPPQLPQPPQPSASPKSHRRCRSAPHNPVCFEATQKASKEDYTSVYKRDFTARKLSKRQPYKLRDSLKTSQGLVVTDGDFTGGHSKRSYFKGSANSTVVMQVTEPKPIESITSYRRDYVSHPVQPRIHREKPNKGLTIEPVMSMRTKVTWDANKKLYHKSEEFFQQFKTLSLETKFHSQGKAKDSSPPSDPNNFLSTTHADYIAHECPRTKPFLPSTQRDEKSKKPFQATTQMKEDYKAWDMLPCFPSVHKEELDWHKKTLSVYTPNLAESSRTSPKTVSPPSTLNETPVCNSSEKPQFPAENRVFYGFECISNGNEDSRRWNTSLNRGGTWLDGDICDEPSKAHQIISCMVSSRS